MATTTTSPLRPMLPFEAAVLVVLVGAGGVLSIDMLLQRILAVFPYWGVEAAAAQMQSGIAPNHGQSPAGQLKNTLRQYDLPFKVSRESPSAAIICAITSIDEAVCALRRLLSPRLRMLQLMALRRHGIQFNIAQVGTFYRHPQDLLTAKGIAVLFNGATGALEEACMLPHSITTTGITVNTTLSDTANLLGLPAELRNTIYKLVLQFPVSGIRIGSDKDPGNAVSRKYIFTQTRDMNEAISTSSWHRRDDEYAPTQDLAPLLRSYPLRIAAALLQVNREIRYEAAPIFYGENRFHFSTLGELLSFIDSAGMETFSQKVREIAFTYDRAHRALGHEALSELGAMTGLVFLSVSDAQAHEEKYTHLQWMNRYHGHAKLKIDLTRRFNNLKTFKLEGCCDNVVRYLIPALKKREERRKQKLTVTYRGDNVCLDSPCLTPACTKWH